MTATNPWPPNNYTRADAAYLKVERFSWAVTCVLLLVPALVPGVLKIFFNVPVWLVIVPPVIVVIIAAWSWRIIRRRVTCLSYCEADNDLSVTSGYLWRKHVVVPYGRMQYVELSSGPIERKYGLCRLTLNTAESSATARILGVPREIGEALRERLVAKGEDQAL